VYAAVGRAVPSRSVPQALDRERQYMRRTRGGCAVGVLPADAGAATNFNLVTSDHPLDRSTLTSMCGGPTKSFRLPDAQVRAATIDPQKEPHAVACAIERMSKRLLDHDARGSGVQGPSQGLLAAGTTSKLGTSNRSMGPCGGSQISGLLLPLASPLHCLVPSHQLTNGTGDGRWCANTPVHEPPIQSDHANVSAIRRTSHTSSSGWDTSSNPQSVPTTHCISDAVDNEGWMRDIERRATSDAHATFLGRIRRKRDASFF
jgi:hypothetical protein